MLVTRLGVTATVILSLFGIGSTENAPTETTTTEQVVHVKAVSPMHPILRTQMRTGKVPSRAFWLAVAHCETHQEWDRGKDWNKKNSRAYVSGGLGIANSTWQGYGGRQFAKKAALATKDEQMIVANRIAFLGYQTKNVFMSLDDKINNRPYFRPRAKTPNWGKNCVDWKTAKPLKKYEEK